MKAHAEASGTDIKVRNLMSRAGGYSLGALLILVAASGCVDADCTPGQQIGCACPGGSSSVQECNSDATYDACQCGETTGDANPSAGANGDGVLSTACATDEDCGDGLTCAKGGPFVGLCTASCETTTDCLTGFGDSSFCESGYCTLVCETPAECPNGHCSRNLMGKDYCTGGKAEFFDLCDEDADCIEELTCSKELGTWGVCTAPCSSADDCNYSGNVEICIPSLNLCSPTCDDNSLFLCPDPWECIAIDDRDGYCAE